MASSAAAGTLSQEPSRTRRASPEASGKEGKEEERAAGTRGAGATDDGMRFEDRLCEHIPPLRRFARALCRDPVLADDLVQDCLLRALRKRHLWRPTGRLRSWLFRMLHRLYLNHRAADARHRDAFAARAAEARTLREGPAHQEARAACGDVLAAVETLPDAQREALLLMALEAPSYREAAHILDVPVGTLRSRLARARETVRRLAEVEGSAAEGPRLRRVK